MNFINTDYLFYLLLSLLAILLVYLWACFRRSRVEKILSKKQIEANASPLKRRLRQAFFIIAWLLLTAAFLRPFSGTEDIQRNTVSRNIMILLDISKSMNVDDAGEMTRLEYAKWWAREFISTHPDDRIGLISFGGTSFLECPMTRDRSILLHKLNAMNTGYMPVGGTDIELALNEALKACSEFKKKQFSVIMLTDGDEVYGKYQLALKEFKKNKPPVHVVGIGSPHVAGKVKDEKGETVKAGQETVKSKSDSNKMVAISKDTGGVYVPFNEGNFDSSQTEISAALNKRNDSLTTETDVFSKPREYFHYPLFLAIILLLARMFISERRRKSKSILVMITFLMLFNLNASAQSEGIAWFKKYTEAVTAAQKAKKPILLAFTGSDWNKTSIRLEDEIFSKVEFSKWAKKRVILLNCDLPRKSISEDLRRQNRQLATKFKAEKIPAVVLLSYDEKVIGRSGYYEGGASAWTERVDKILTGNKRMNKSPSSFGELPRTVQDSIISEKMSSEKKALNLFNYSLQTEKELYKRLDSSKDQKNISKDNFSLLQDLYSNASNQAENNKKIIYEAELKLGVLNHRYGLGVMGKAPDIAVDYFDTAVFHYSNALTAIPKSSDAVNNLLLVKRDRRKAQDQVDLKELLDEAVQITKEARKKEKYLKDALEKWVATEKKENNEKIQKSKESISRLRDKAEQMEFERTQDFNDALDDIIKAPKPHLLKYFSESYKHVNAAYKHLLSEQERQEEERKEQMQEEQQPQNGEPQPKNGEQEEQEPQNEDDEGEEEENEGNREEEDDTDDGSNEGEISKNEGRSLLRSMDDKRQSLRDRMMKERTKEAKKRSNYGKGVNDR